MTVFPIAIGDDADMGFLNQLSTQRQAVKLRNLEAFTVFFKWLSSSMAQVSASSTHGSDDAKVATETEHVGQIALPDATGPAGWATV